ncbi:hypothetical protein ACHQM5_026467 [Ranunculus cassubicifolius]
MAMKNFYNEIKGLKVREVYTYLKPKFTVEKAKQFVSNGLDNYQKKYIETSSPEPIFHLCFGGMIFSYLVALPNERRHLAHKEQHAKGAAH